MDVDDQKTHRTSRNLQTIADDSVLEDEDTVPEIQFFATGNDGKVIKLHQRIASIPIGLSGKLFQQQLEKDLEQYTNDEILAISPFEMVGRGIAGVDEMRDSLDDNFVFFGMLQIEVGEGQFARYKNIFVHFQGERMRPLHRAKANRFLAAAKEIIGHCHAPLTVQRKEEFTIDWIFNELKRVFTADNIRSGQGGKLQDLSSIKLEYRKKMESVALLAEEERKRLRVIKREMIEEAKRRALEEEKERLIALREEQEQKQREMEEEKRRILEEERRIRKEKEKKEREEAKAEAERIAAKEALNNPQSNNNVKKKKKRKRKRGFKKKKKDDWSDARPWTPERIVSAIHSEMSPYNWCIFEPSKTTIKPVKWGHGSISELRQELAEDAVQYGLMRLSFGSGRFRRSHWIFFVWTPDTMTTNSSGSAKINKKRMRHVSYKPQMAKMLAPWTLTLTAECLEQVTISEWLMRVKKTVVVDNDEALSEDAFKNALLEEQKFIEQLHAKNLERQKKLAEEAAKEKELAIAKELLERSERADADQDTIYSQVALKNVDSSGSRYGSNCTTPKFTADGSFLHPATVQAMEEARKRKQMNETENKVEENVVDESEEEYEESEESVREETPELAIVITLSQEELAVLEKDRMEKEAIELAKRTEREMNNRKILQSKLVLESVELCKRTSEKLVWILYAPKNTNFARK